MDASTDIWFAFVKTAGMLALVIALLIGLLYAVRRMSSVRSGRGGKAMIRVLAMHHFSPKEKVALLEIDTRRVLVGITPQAITSIADFGAGEETGGTTSGAEKEFDALLKTEVAGKAPSTEIPDTRHAFGDDHDR